jgi:hypothetical protein
MSQSVHYIKLKTLHVSVFADLHIQQKLSIFVILQEGDKLRQKRVVFSIWCNKQIGSLVYSMQSLIL